MRWYRARDTFTGGPGPGERTVQAGQTLPETDALVQLDAGRGHLFELVDSGEPAASNADPKAPAKGRAAAKGDG